MTDPEKSYCNTCVGIRSHDVLHKEVSSWNEDIDEHFGVYGSDTYSMVRCRGCGHVSVRRQSTFSENVDSDGELIVATQYYPPPIFRSKPRWFADAWRVFGVIPPHFVVRLLNEIYVALQNDLPSLAAMGIRSLIEHVMVERVGDQGSFAANLTEFRRQGNLSDMQLKSLESLIEAGHAAMHRGYSPGKGELTSLMDIIESIIETIYFSEHRVNSLQEKVPARRQKNNGDVAN